MTFRGGVSGEVVRRRHWTLGPGTQHTQNITVAQFTWVTTRSSKKKYPMYEHKFNRIEMQNTRSRLAKIGQKQPTKRKGM